MKYPVPLKALICVYLTVEDVDIKNAIEEAIISDSVKRVKKKSSPGLKALRKGIKDRVGEILPFEIGAFEEAIANIIASDIPTKYRRDPDPLGYIFGSSSIINAGAFRVTNQSATYLDTWFDEDKSDEVYFRLFPNEKNQLRKSIEKLNGNPARVSVKISDRIQMVLHLPGRLSLGDLQLFKSSQGRWSVSLIDPDSAKCNTPARGLSFKYNSDAHAIEIEASQPEIILQLSAAASEKRWMLLSLGEFAAFFTVPELDEDSGDIPVWTTSWDQTDEYLWTKSSYFVQIDQALIIKCCRRFHWFFSNIDKFPFHTLAKEINKT